MDGDPTIGTEVARSMPKGFLVGVLAQIKRAHVIAPAVIQANTPLRPYRAALMAGHLRYNLIEETFERHGENMGGENLFRRALPGYPDSVVFMPLQMFGKVVVGFATHSGRGALPTRNLTRSRAVQLNLSFDPRFDLGDVDPALDYLFVCMLVARDPADATKVASIELGVIDPKFERFLFRESLDEFLLRYEPAALPAKNPSLVKQRRTPRKKSGNG